jgi:myo-inositol-1(or 4)-monophosphatase
MRLYAESGGRSTPLDTTSVDFAVFVERLAQISGDAILPFFRSAVPIDDKSEGGAFDPVTEADRAAEAAMRRLIGGTFPTHGVVGEEYGADRADAEYVWILDPIDGTKSFISGLPMWGTLIGLLHKGKPVYGMMSQPFTTERYFGDCRRSEGRGLLFLRGGEGGARILRTRACASLATATLMTTSPLLLGDHDRAIYYRIEKRARLTRYGGDCYAYCMLALGLVDVIVEANLKPYDIAPLVPIIEGAGGVVTDWEGGPAARGGRIIAAGDRRVYDEAMELLSG